MRNFITVILLVAALLAAGLRQPARAVAGPLRIAVSFADMSRTIFQIRAKMIQDEAEKLGNVKIDVYDAKNKQDNQNADLQTVIDQKYDGVLISPVNSDGSIPAIQAVIDAGIPVVTLVRSAKGVQTLAHIGTDDTRGGQLQAQIIMQLFPNGARLFNIQGTPGASTAVQRNQGLHAVLDKNPNYKIIYEQPANFLRPDGQQVMTKALEAGTPLPDLINSAGEEMTFGVLDVLKDKGLVGKVVIVSWDSSPQTLMLIQDGTLAATVEPFPGKQAQIAFNTMMDFLRDGKEPAHHDIAVEPILLTKSNLADAERYAELLAPATPGATSTAAATMEATSSK